MDGANTVLLDAVLSLLVQPGGAYAGDDPERHRSRIAWQLERRTWFAIGRVGATGRYIWVAHWVPVPEPLDLVAYVGWWDLSAAAMERMCCTSVEVLARLRDPLPMQTGPHVYVCDLAMAPGAGGARLAWVLWRLLISVRPAAVSVAAHRQRADGRRRWWRTWL